MNDAFWHALACRLGWAVLHSLWQATACALALAVALRLTRRSAPSVRYGLASLVLAATVAWAAATFVSSTPPPAQLAAPLAVMPTAVVSPQQTDRPTETIVTRPLATPLDAQVVAAGAAPAPVPWSQRIQPLLPWLSATWALGVALLALWNLCVLLAVHRLRVVGVQPAGPPLDALLARLADRMHLRPRRVTVARSLLAAEPLVIGWLRPLILMPVSVLTGGLTLDQLEHILAHELAHVRRHDYLVNLLQVAAETLLFYHPAVWWISRRIRLEREQCCDEIATTVTGGDRVAYAESLAALASLPLATTPLALAARGSGSGELLHRVRRLLAANDDAPRRGAARLWVAALSLVTVIGCAAAGHWGKHSPPDEPKPDAAALVREVRDSQNWIGHTDGFHLRATGRFTYAAGHDPSLDQPTPHTLEIGFDPSGHALLDQRNWPGEEHGRRVWTQEQRRATWDGNRLVTYTRFSPDYPQAPREFYTIEADPLARDRLYDELLGELAWGRVGPSDSRVTGPLPCLAPKDADELYGRPEDFHVAARETFHGLDCYRLENASAGEGGHATRHWKLYVGVADHRLYGQAMLDPTPDGKGEQPWASHWMTDYRQVAPGRWFPMTQATEYWNFDKEHIGEPPRVLSTLVLKIDEVTVGQPLPDQTFAWNFAPGVPVEDLHSPARTTSQPTAEPDDTKSKVEALQYYRLELRRAAAQRNDLLAAGLNDKHPQVLVADKEIAKLKATIAALEAEIVRQVNERQGPRGPATTRAAATTQPADTEPADVKTQAATLQDLRARLDKANTRRGDLLGTGLSEQHPQILAIDKEIANLKTAIRAARARIVRPTEPAATAPATQAAQGNGDPSLLKLPATLPSNRVALRVEWDNHRPVDIADLQSLSIYDLAGQRWIESKRPPVRERYADGWFTLDADLFVLSQPGTAVQIVGTGDQGEFQIAVGQFPLNGGRRIRLTSDIPSPPPPDPSVSIDNAMPAAPDEIAGRVVDAQHRPVAGAVVKFPQPQELRSIRPENAVTTGADGVFRYPHFGKQHFLFLQIDKPGFAPRWLVDLPLGHAFTVQLDDQTRLRGKLTLPDGSPAAAATIYLSTSRRSARPNMGPIDPLTITATAGPDGAYDVPLEPGSYDARLSSADGAFAAGREQLTVPAGKATALPPALAPAPTLTIHAVDALTGRPVANLGLVLQERHPGVSGPIKGSERTTDANGVVHWDHLVPGRAEIATMGREAGRWWIGTSRKPPRDASAEMNGLFVNVPAAGADLTVTIEPAARLTGQVLAPDGKPATGVLVDMADVRTGDARYAQRTDADGRFAIRFIDDHPTVDAQGRPPSSRTFRVVAYDPQRRWANAISEPVSPAAGEAAAVTIRFTPGGRVKGRVVEKAGKPVARIEVEADPADQLDRGYYNPRTLTDDAGRFDLGPMRATHYLLFADTKFGVNIVPAPGYTPLDVDVVEGQTQNVPDLVHPGAPPPPIPKEYDRFYPNDPPSTAPAKGR